MIVTASSAGTDIPRAGLGVSADDGRPEAIEALEGSFAELMTAYRHHLAAAADRVHPGMLPGTFKVLSLIARSGSTTLSALTEQLASDKGLVSRSVSELEGLGLITRTLDPDDRRSRLISVTPTGSERLAAARAPHQGRLFTVLEDWSVDDIQQLSQLLHSLASGETPHS